MVNNENTVCQCAHVHVSYVHQNNNTEKYNEMKRKKTSNDVNKSYNAYFGQSADCYIQIERTRAHLRLTILDCIQ